MLKGNFHAEEIVDSKVTLLSEGPCPGWGIDRATAPHPMFCYSLPLNLKTSPMNKALKTTLLDLLSRKELAPAVEQLLAFLPEDHSSVRRTRQLEKRLRELEGRMEMGTLSPEDIDRVQARIGGGLREIILDYKPDPAPASAPTKDQPQESFTLNLQPEALPEKEAPVAEIGFFGTVEYAGSPSKKEETITLSKSYGASYHIAVQAIRKSGMEMVSGDRAGGRIYATSAGNSMARLGEIIHLWITPLDRARTRIHVVVDSADPGMAFDLGRHKQKLTGLLHQLRNG